MYDVELLCKKFNDAGVAFTSYDVLDDSGLKLWTPDSSILKSLATMPEENFQKLLEMDYTGYKDYNSIYQEWGRRGYLLFVPFVRDDGSSNPTLTIRHNRHLHLFRGHQYQVSGTPEGRISCEQGSYRIDFLLNHNLYSVELWRDSVLANMLCYAAVIDTAFVYDNFRDWFNNHTEDMVNFVKKSFAGWRREVKYDWSKMQEYISYESEWTDPDRQLYRITCKRGVVCEFAFGRQTVQVCTNAVGFGTRMLTIRVPHYLEGVSDADEWDEDDLEEFRRSVTMPRSDSERVDIKMILIMAMALSGIRINWMGSYPIIKLNTISGTNAPGVRVVESLDDLTKWVADAF